jgi:hypothetical protein
VRTATCCVWSRALRRRRGLGLHAGDVGALCTEVAKLRVSTLFGGLLPLATGLLLRSKILESLEKVVPHRDLKASFDLADPQYGRGNLRPAAEVGAALRPPAVASHTGVPTSRPCEPRQRPRKSRPPIR